MSVESRIFKQGSTTYYWSSVFFPRGVRDDVFKLYSFVRYVDYLVDKPTPDLANYHSIVKAWEQRKKSLSKSHEQSEDIRERVLDNIVDVVIDCKCEPEWVDAFLASMQMDIDQRRYKTLDEVLEYIYGSAEVIGLFMAQIMGLPSSVREQAKLQGRAMQYINFLRDIEEDNSLGRCYIAHDILTKYTLKNVSKDEAHKHPENFTAMMREQLALYKQWQDEASVAFKQIPRRLRVPLKTAVAMYNWTAQQISQDPLRVFEHKIKPSKQRVIYAGVKNTIHG